METFKTLKTLKTLKVGDWVTISWHKDNEPHKIVSIWESNSVNNVECTSDPCSSIFLYSCADRIAGECELWNLRKVMFA